MAYTTINDPSLYFQTVLYTGTGGTRSVTNDGNSDLQPDWVWIKNRGTAYQHQVYDTSRGATKKLLPSNTNDETTDTNALTSFNTDGYSVGSNVGVNQNTKAHVAWQWKANGGTTATNTSGTVDSVVQANTVAGFSIALATAPSSNGVWSFGHGLGVKPDMVITKQRDGGGWWTWHKDLTNQTTYYLGLNQTDAETNEANMWGGGMTSSVIGVSSPNSTLTNQPYIAYCFASKQGYSKFGKYVANAVIDGPFVYTGFKPAFLMIKNTNRAEPWMIYDNKRTPSNQINTVLQSNSNSTDSTAAGDYATDFLSNGFKIRAVGTGYANHTVGNKYIFMAFAEAPFVTSDDGGSIPTTAR